MFKHNKLIIYVYSNSFHLFISIIEGLRNLKICKILIIFDLFFIFSLTKPNMRKSFSLVVFFFP